MDKIVNLESNLEMWNDDVEGVNIFNEDESDGEEEIFFDSDYDIEEDDMMFDLFVDHEVEFFGANKEKGVATNEIIGNDLYARLQAEDGDFDCVGSEDEFASNNGSDDENTMKYPMHNPRTDNKNPELKVGLIFSSKNEAKFVIESHCLRRGMMMKFIKNDKIRLRAVCKNEGCDWFVYVSKMQNDNSWQIKSSFLLHNRCSWNFNNSCLKSGWIAKTFVNKLKKNPKLDALQFRREVCDTMKADVSKSQAYRARKKAKQLIDGKMEEQCNKIWDYCEEIQRTNPGSTVIMKLLDEEGSQQKRFHRFYMCLNACKLGFKNACRPIIGVDGCFLKGRYRGQLLTAVGIDPNNQIFPIAYAIVENETKDSWLWFLKVLDGDIGFENDHKWTFISDKQKCLIPAFESFLPNAENRFCVRHLHSNMKRDGFSSIAIKNALWAAAKSTVIKDFERKMLELKMIDDEAYNWLIKKSPQHWSRSHFSTYPKCDILLNNICESFNSFILNERESPIIQLLEGIRNLLMTRMQVNREKAAKWVGTICPNVKKILDKVILKAAECAPMRSDEWHFQVTGPFDQHNVDLWERTCSCRRWDLTGIPCKHAISSIWSRKETIETYVHQCYSVNSYLSCYEHTIYGVNSPELWPSSNNIAPLPPTYAKMIGIPKKLRRREPNEPPAASYNPHRLRGVKRINKCRTCGSVGHNSKTCSKRTMSESAQENREIVSNDVNYHSQPIIAADGSNGLQGTQASISTDHVQQNKISNKEKLQVRRPKKNMQIREMPNRIASVKINQSSSMSRTHVIVKKGMNFVTLPNLKSSASNLRCVTSQDGSNSCCSDPKNKSN